METQFSDTNTPRMFERPPLESLPEVDEQHDDTITMGAYLSAHPMAIYSRNFIERTQNVLRGAREDIRHSEHPYRDIAWGIGTVATQAVDRFRITTILAPEAAIWALENTDNNSLAAGAAAAGVFAVWNYVTGETLTQTLDRFDKGEEEFKENFPVIVELFTDSLPGIAAIDEEGVETHKEATEDEGSLAVRGLRKTMDRVRDGVSRVGTHVRRAFSGFSLGSTAFVATSSVNGYDKPEVRKHNLKVTADTGGLIFGLGFGISKYVNHLVDQGEFERAQDIMNVLDNNLVWYGLAGASLGMELIATRRKKNKLLHEQSSELET